MATSEVPLYDERFLGYGLNKISHLATVAQTQSGGYHGLPGVVLVTPAHERSESWSEIYGYKTDDANSIVFGWKVLRTAFAIALKKVRIEWVNYLVIEYKKNWDNGKPNENQQQQYWWIDDTG